MWDTLQKLERKKNPFAGEVEALRKVAWVKPELVAEIEYAEWTGGADGGTPKLRAPVFLALRADKDPNECLLPEAPLPYLLPFITKTTPYSHPPRPTPPTTT